MLPDFVACVRPLASIHHQPRFTVASDGRALSQIKEMTKTREQFLTCPVCDSALAETTLNWLYRCPACGLERSTLDITINDTQREDMIDEDEREQALRPLRLETFRTIIGVLQSVVPLQDKELLDVGCAHGWFLDEAKAAGAVTHGIEPEAGIIERMDANDHKIWHGFFPDDLSAKELFDVITFNDVLEHLPDVRGCLKACHARLNPGGCLLVNLPDRNGFFYRLARILMAVGIRGPFERLWQKNFKSPHLSYFNAGNLKQLAEREGFTEVKRFSLPSVQFKGLWSRIRYDRSVSLVKALFLWLCVLFALPLLNLFPADINVQIFRKR